MKCKTVVTYLQTDSFQIPERMAHEGLVAEGLVSCDTFVMVSKDRVVFGKNSDRPEGEVQELVQVAPARHEPGTRLQVSHDDTTW